MECMISLFDLKADAENDGLIQAYQLLTVLAVQQLKACTHGLRVVYLKLVQL